MITRTIGAGGDHTDWYAFWAWVIANDNPGTNDYLCIQISDVALSGSMLATGGWDPAGHSVEFRCPYADSHQGDPTKGFKTTCPGGVGGVILQQVGITVGCTYIVDGLWIDGSASPGFSSLVVQASYGTSYVRNCLVKAAASFDTSAVVVANFDGSTAYVSNLKIWNAGGEGFGWHAGATGGPIGEKVVENVTIWDCGKLISPSYAPFSAVTTGYTVRNCVVADSGGTDFKLHPGVMHYNCACQDGTLVGATVANPINTFVTADEFQSLDDTNEKFLFLIEGTKAAFADYNPSHGPKPLDVQFGASVEYSPAESVLAQSGTEPTYAGDEDIAGTPRPNEDGTYAIGCHEQIYNPLYSRDQ